MMMQLEDIRREYLQGNLEESSLDSNPIKQFERWVEQAIDAKMLDPTAMTLATVNEQGQPAQRIVLLKHFDEDGFVFYTNYSSSKAKDLELNNFVSLHFPWHTMERQVNVSGKAIKIPVEQSQAYFASRPRDSQIAAWASPQSKEVSSRQFLMDRVEEFSSQFTGQDVPLPDFWGGYCVVPESIEFWQGGAHRLHDRVLYSLQRKVNGDDESIWAIQRLAP